MDSSYYCCSSKDQTKFWLQVGQVFHSSLALGIYVQLLNFIFILFLLQC